MEHNQYLNEILSLIKKYHEDKKIQNNDLQKIGQLIFTLGGSPFDKINEIENNNKFLFTSSVFSLWSPEKKAKEYLQKFKDDFREDSRLNKIFQVKSTLFNASLSNGKKEDIVLRFIEYNNNFELVYMTNEGNFWVNCEKQTLEPITDLEKHTTAFEITRGLGEELDKKLGSKNTRKITISYDGNFNNTNDPFTLSDDNYIYFVPAVISNSASSSNNRFTLLMFFNNTFIPLFRKSPIYDVNEIYYDTFQLCPPYPSGSSSC